MLTKGIKTSEFLLTLSIGGLILADGTQNITIPWEHISAYAVTVATYTGARGMTKAADMKTDVVGLAKKVRAEMGL